MRPRFGSRVRGADGFTLIELLVVISLIFTLSGIALVNYQNSIRRTREAVLKQDLFRMRDAIDQFYADKNKYPVSLDELVTEKYLRRVPEDPFTGSTDTWQTVMSDPDPLNPTAQPGIYDIKSGSDQTALDGTRYSEWN
jgi:general secretion pathway protein G